MSPEISEAEAMDQVTCVDISVYKNFLTRGKIYDVLAYNAGKNELEIRADTDRIQWFPAYCFKSDKEPIAKLKNIHIDDKIERPYSDTVEVTITLLIGEIETKRWCYFLTPALLYGMFRLNPLEPEICGPHGIFLPVLTVDTITDAIHYLEAQNRLEACTLPVGEESD